MKCTLGTRGLRFTWPKQYPWTVKCHHHGCNGTAKVAFVAHEGRYRERNPEFVAELHQNEPGAYWPEGLCAFAVYICTTCTRCSVEYFEA